MDEERYNEIKKYILRKLVRKRMWMHKHTSIHNLPKGLPDKIRYSKEVRKVVEDLLKSSLLLSKPTNYGLEVFLNIKKKEEIMSFVFE